LAGLGERGAGAVVVEGQVVFERDVGRGAGTAGGCACGVIAPGDVGIGGRRERGVGREEAGDVVGARGDDFAFEDSFERWRAI
jgi:hypothetical protein